MQLTPDPHNANKGTIRGKHALTESLKRHGPGRSIVADKNGVIIGGNKTYERAKELGLELEYVHTAGDKLVVVVRDDLDLEQDPSARELAYADNRVAELDLNMDLDQLQADLEQDLDLAYLYRPDELEKLIGETRQMQQTDDNEDDKEPEEEEDDDGEYEEPEEEDEPPDDEPPARNLIPKHVLPIVLNDDEFDRWQQVKAQVGVQRDKSALMKMVDLRLAEQ
jgi:hypothetical protein